MYKRQVNVTAKDLGTNKEQSITITSSTNLTDEEIEKMRKEAEENKESINQYNPSIFYCGWDVSIFSAPSPRSDEYVLSSH